MADSLPLENDKAEIDILIGADYVWDILSGDKLTLPSGLYLISSRLGYVLTGPYLTKADDSLDSQQPDAVVTLCHTLVTSQLTNNIEQFWELDTIGINNLATPSSDDVAVTHLHDTIQYNDGRYVVSWPWKSNADELPSNFDISFTGLKSLSCRLQNDRPLLE